MQYHAIIDPIVRTVPLDTLSAVAFAAVFVLVLIATCMRPAYALVALIFTDPFAWQHYVGPTTITLGKSALVAAAVGIGVRLVRDRGTGREIASLVRSPVFLATVALLCATVLSFVPATDHAATARETLKTLQYLLTFAVAYLASGNRKDAEGSLLAATATIVSIVSALALAQLVLGTPSGIWVHDHPIPRVTGPLEGPNQLAGFLGIGLSVIAACHAYQPRRRTAAVLALGSLALILTLSRTGIAAGIVSLLTVALLGDLRRRRALAIPAACGLVAGVVVLGAVSFSLTQSPGGLAHIISSAQAEHPGSVGTRAQLWDGAFALWRTHPMLGIGAGNFENEVGAVEHLAIRTHANSWYVQSLVEGGIPLLAATLAVVATALRVFGSGRRDPIVLGALAATVGFALHQVVDDLVFYPKVAVMWWIVLGIASARAGNPER